MKSFTQKPSDNKPKKISEQYNSSPPCTTSHIHHTNQPQTSNLHRDITSQQHKPQKITTSSEQMKRNSFISPNSPIVSHTQWNNHEKLKETFTTKSMFSADWGNLNSRTTSPMSSKNSSPRTAPLSSPRVSPHPFSNNPHQITNTFSQQYAIGTGVSLPSSPQISYAPILNLNPLEPNFMALPSGSLSDRQRDKAAMEALVSVQNQITGTRR
uniref:Uncharacterized protein n=1 Tax=Ciona savignyi TaxID=51511 RepID=H2YKN5_CIOSA